MDEYLKVNKSLWNAKTDINFKSEFYDVDSFKKGKSTLNFAELDSIGNVKGKTLLHLQCHFGMDSLSWARLGAKVTGIDLSDNAIETARALNDELGLDAEFICSDIYGLKQELREKFDIVFTSYGTIGWLPDLNKWAEVVSYYLKPGGMFYLADFHPVRWMFDDDCKKIEYSYFNRGEIIEEISGSYADRTKALNHLSYSWNHPLSDIFSALLAQGLIIKEFREFPFSFYNCFSNTVKNADGYWEVNGLEDKLPLMYSIKAVKPE